MAGLVFELHAVIDRPRADVFAFFRDMDQHAGQEGSVVPVYDKVTPGPTGVGTRYREVVRLFPFPAGEVISEITRFRPGRELGYTFSGLGMDGDLVYRFEPVEGGTRVDQRQRLRPRGLLKVARPLIGLCFGWAVRRRLAGIKSLLEG